MTKGLDKYLQEEQQLRDSEDNYFNAITRSMNTSLMMEVDEQIDKTINEEFVPAKQQSFETTESKDNTPESQMKDTGHSLQDPVTMSLTYHRSK